MDDCVHRYLIRDVEAEKHGVPFNVGQLFDDVQIWYARGVLQLHAHRLVVVDSFVDVGLKQRTRKGI